MSRRPASLDAFDAECRLEMIRLHETGRWTIPKIARRFGTGNQVVSAILKLYQPTQRLAERHIQANALQLAERLTATVTAPADIADLLSRPNLGVLKPLRKEPQAPQILMSITQTSLGGVIDGPPSVGMLLPLPERDGGEAAHPPASAALATSPRLGRLPPRVTGTPLHGTHRHQDGTPATVLNGRLLRPEEERNHRQGKKRSVIHLDHATDKYPEE